MKIAYSYNQRAVVRCTGSLEVPDEIMARGDLAVQEYIRCHEDSATDTDFAIVAYKGEIVGSMEYRS